MAGEKVELHKTGSRCGPTPRWSKLFRTRALKVLKERIDAIVISVVLQGLGSAGLGDPKPCVIIIEIMLNKAVQLSFVMEPDEMHAWDKS